MTTSVETATAPTRADLARQALLWGQVEAQAKARAAACRAELEAQARAELARDGVAPTWRIPDVGTVPLYLTSDQVVVADESAYAAWVAARYPGEVEVRVRPAFDERFRRSLVERGDPPCTADGEMVPGLVFRAGGEARGIAVRASADAKAAAAVLADRFLSGLLSGGEG